MDEIPHDFWTKFENFGHSETDCVFCSRYNKAIFSPALKKLRYHLKTILQLCTRDIAIVSLYLKMPHSFTRIHSFNNISMPTVVELGN